MIDAVLAATGTVPTRVRDLPSRVVVHLLLAAGLFAELGYGQVWARMISERSSPASPQKSFALRVGDGGGAVMPVSPDGG
jgi:hypothetical protein